MNLTFKGFLKAYCIELSGINTSNIRRLANAANTFAPRVTEPLFVYSAASEKLNYLLSVSSGTWMHEDYLTQSKVLNREYENILDFLKSEFAPKRYAAVLDAYYSNFEIIEANRRILNELRPKVQSCLDKSGYTKYKVCKELKINPGNFYAYMAGDNSKITKDIAYELISLTDK